MRDNEYGSRFKLLQQFEIIHEEESGVIAGIFNRPKRAKNSWFEVVLPGLSFPVTITIHLYQITVRFPLIDYAHYEIVFDQFKQFFKFPIKIHRTAMFLETIDKRRINLNQLYEMWMKNPESSDFNGENFRPNNNSDFQGLPLKYNPVVKGQPLIFLLTRGGCLATYSIEVKNDQDIEEFQDCIKQAYSIVKPYLV